MHASLVSKYYNWYIHVYLNKEHILICIQYYGHSWQWLGGKATLLHVAVKHMDYPSFSHCKLTFPNMTVKTGKHGTM